MRRLHESSCGFKRSSFNEIILIRPEGSDMDKDRAIGIIDRVWSRYGLKAHEAAVFVSLLFAADGKGECSMTVGEISETCGRSKSSVRRAIRSLEEKGLLKREAQYYEDEGNARAENKYILRTEA